MKIACAGGGPGGLWFAIGAKLLDPTHEITVLERRPPHSTYGWGIVYWHSLLEGVRQVDPATARQIAGGSVRWAGQRVVVQDKPPVHLGGTGFSMNRRRLIDILAQRAQALGVRIEHEHEVADLSVASEADLVVLADGANSRLRRSRATSFGTVERLGRNKHIWLSSRVPFADFTFVFEPTAAGWLWFHAYRFTPGASTIIVECAESTWSGLGFDSMSDDSCLKELSRIFSRHLNGAELEGRADVPGVTQWATFPTVSNTRWFDRNVVLLGDSAHTAHFSIGSGTRMAIEDATALARAVASCPPARLAEAVRRYQDRRLPAVVGVQREAERSAAWFENVDRNIELEPLAFGYALRTRRDRPIPEDPQLLRSTLGFQLHRATQWRAGRAARRVVAAARRVARRLRVAERRAWDSNPRGAVNS